MKTHLLSLFFLACGSSTPAEQAPDLGSSTQALKVLKKHALPEGQWINAHATSNPKQWVLESATDDLYLFDLDAFDGLTLLPAQVSNSYSDDVHGWLVEVSLHLIHFRITEAVVSVKISSLDGTLLTELVVASTFLSTLEDPEFGGVVSPALIGKATLQGATTNFSVTANDVGSPVINVLTPGEVFTTFAQVGDSSAHLSWDFEGKGTIAVWKGSSSTLSLKPDFHAHSIAASSNQLVIKGGQSPSFLDTLAFITLP